MRMIWASCVCALELRGADQETREESTKNLLDAMRDSTSEEFANRHVIG